MIFFVKDYPCLILRHKNKRYMIISDLHLGISLELEKKGFFLPSQAENLANKLNRLKKITRAKEIIILGDLKHNIPLALKYEKTEINKFLSKIKFEKIILLKGNHDGRIENIIRSEKDIIIPKEKFFVIGKYVLTHGHIKLNKKLLEKNIIIGHIHPFIKMRDKFSFYYEPVWLVYKDEKREIIIMPAFNDLCGATIANEQELIGPIAKNLDKKKINVYLLDGTLLDNLDALWLGE
jgi:putative SbcD/Mre11-related phosphoesterase